MMNITEQGQMTEQTNMKFFYPAGKSAQILGTMTGYLDTDYPIWRGIKSDFSGNNGQKK